MACPDLCTAAKCQELEARIGALEQALELLEASFEAHTQQDIPTAHEYSPEVTVNVVVEGKDLIVDVTVDGQSDFSDVTLPLDTSVAFDIFPTDNQYVFKVTVNGETDEDTLSLPELGNLDVDVSFNSSDELVVSIQDGDRFADDSTSLPNSNLTLEAYDIDDNSIALVIQHGLDRDQEIITFPDNNNNHVESNLKITASYFDDILTISVADGESQDTAQVTIDAQTIIRRGGGGNVSCEQIGEDLQNCCAEILAAINSVSNQVQRVENEITIDITDTINTEYKCIENEETKQIEPKLVPKNYSNKGFLGLHEHLKLMSANLDAIYKPLCEVKNETVVTLVASNRFVNKISDKVLNLHFVTLDNYPLRKNGSNYRQVQIPAPLEEYSWLEHFDTLRWTQGNQFAELRFKQNYVPVAGWFADKDAADIYFDAVLALTTATEDNRVYPEHKSPKTAIPIQISRPYRAFINSVNIQGKAVCHTKYVPVIDE